jgi:sugar phosphate isomerase/epimerase
VVINGGLSPSDLLVALRSRAAQGFESVEVAFKNTLGGLNLAQAAPAIRDLGIPISCLGIYGNTLAENAHGEEIRGTLREMIALAPKFGTDLVCCFTGRITGRPLPESLPRFREVFSELSHFAADHGVRIAFENCTQGGNWASGDRNIAFCEDAWELMFDAVPSSNLGLEWEPAHHLCQLVAPLPQLRRWLEKGRIFHLHGKDAEIRREDLARHGTHSSHYFGYHRLPGLGESNWSLIIAELYRSGFRGSIDIEGGHDPVYRGELEAPAQRMALSHLKSCRPG